MMSQVSNLRQTQVEERRDVQNLALVRILGERMPVAIEQVLNVTVK